MTGKGQRTLGVWLAIAAGALLLWASVTWTSETRRAERDAAVAAYTAAELGAYSPHDPHPDHTGSFVLIGAGVVLLLSGVIFFAAARD